MSSERKITLALSDGECQFLRFRRSVALGRLSLADTHYGRENGANLRLFAFRQPSHALTIRRASPAGELIARAPAAALAWRLIGLPTLSVHPADPDAPAMMIDRRVAWYLVRSRRLRVPKQWLTAHQRTVWHPMLQNLAAWRFTVANVAPGLDRWTVHRTGQRFDVQVTLTKADVRFDVDGHGGDESAWTLVFPNAVPPAALAAVAIGLRHIPASRPDEQPDAAPETPPHAACGNAH